MNLVNGNDKKTNRYIYERMCSPVAPRQCHTNHNNFHYGNVLQHTNYCANFQREQAITQQTRTLEETNVSTLKFWRDEYKVKYLLVITHQSKLSRMFRFPSPFFSQLGNLCVQKIFFCTNENRYLTKLQHCTEIWYWKNQSWYSNMTRLKRERAITRSSTFTVKTTAPAASKANATAKTSVWLSEAQQKKLSGGTWLKPTTFTL